MRSTHPEAALVPYAAGELSADERARVEHHLRECPRCRESLDSSTLVLRELARDLASIAEPDWTVYRAELRRRLAAETSRRHARWRPVLTWASLATAGLAAGALVLAIALRPGSRLAAPPVDELAMQNVLMGADVGLLRDYPVVAHLDMLENYDIIEHLDELAPQNGAGHASRS
jgi:anti-sigma factor RsiW